MAPARLLSQRRDWLWRITGIIVNLVDLLGLDAHMLCWILLRLPFNVQYESLNFLMPLSISLSFLKEYCLQQEADFYM